jgi:glycosyltransferase involved in cell wall biosynthesis
VASKQLMRILYLTPTPPYPPTDGHRIHEWTMLRALVEEGHEVALISVTRDGNGGEQVLRELCSSLDFVPSSGPSRGWRSHLRRLRSLASPDPFAAITARSEELAELVRCRLGAVDLVICDMVYLAQNLPRMPRPPVLIDTQHVAHELFARYLPYVRNPFGKVYLWLEYRKTLRWEKKACAQATAVGACSPREEAHFRQLCPNTPVVTIPNVVDTDEYRPTADSHEPLLAFTGVLDWFPNQDAILFFAQEILPELRRLVPGVRLRVAGQCNSQRFRGKIASFPAIELIGFVPDIRAAIADAAVCVVPLRMGSGTRLKVLEAAAMAKPVVSTSLGAEGLQFIEGKEILLADRPGDFAQAIARLLKDAQLRRALGLAARHRVEECYSLPVLRGAVREALDRLGDPEPVAP